MNEELENTSESKLEHKPARDERGRLLPGNTANPYGKPPGSLSIIAEIKKQLDEVADEDPQKRKKLTLLVRKIMLKAINEGDTAMIKDIIDRIHGKPTQPIDLGTDNEIWDKLEKIEKRLKDEQK